MVSVRRGLAGRTSHSLASIIAPHDSFLCARSRSRYEVSEISEPLCGIQVGKVGECPIIMISMCPGGRGGKGARLRVSGGVEWLELCKGSRQEHPVIMICSTTTLAGPLANTRVLEKDARCSYESAEMMQRAYGSVRRIE